MGGGPIQQTQDMLTSGGDVVGRAGFDLGNPQRELVGRGQHLDQPAVLAGFAGVPQIDRFPLHAGGFLAAPVAGEDLAVEDQMRTVVVAGMLDGFVQVQAPAARTSTPSSR